MLRLRPFTEAGIFHAVIDMDEANPPDTNILSPEEKLRYGMFGPARQKNFLAARAVSKYLIQQSGSTLPPEMITTITPEGKPVVPPGCGAGSFYLSIAHDSTCCIGVISQLRCGIDVETVSGRVRRVSTRLLTESERDIYSGSGSDEELTRIWTIKEAAAKMLGISIIRAMSAVTVTSLSESISSYKYEGNTFSAVHAVSAEHIFTVTQEK
jgi:phosphopantetheinyl transferase